MAKSKVDKVVARLPENGVLKVDPRNVRVHGRENTKRIKQSLEAIGAGRGILADGENIIRAGNGIYEQAKKLGFKFKIVDVDDKTILVSRRPDLKGKKAIRAAMLDNLASDSSAYDYDADILADVVNNDALLKSIAADDERLQELLGVEDETPNDDEHAAELVDKAAELQKKWRVKLGDVWECGEHRIICGDCTEADVVSKLLVDQKVNLCLSDPPYGIGNSKTAKNKYVGYDDTEENLKNLLTKFLPLAQQFADVIVLSTGIKNHRLYPKPDWVLCWFSSAGIGRGPWGFCCWQPLLVYGKDPYLKNMRGSYPDSYASNDSDKSIPHPCAKPLSVWQWFLNRCSFNEGDAIYDPFLGSGTTMIACENLNRKCRAIELNPAYVAVALQRWSDLTGLKPKRL